MEESRPRRHFSHRPRDYSRIPEQVVQAEIAYYQQRLAALAGEADRHTGARREVYRTLIRQRRKLLAAIRAGRPADWPLFTAA